MDFGPCKNQLSLAVWATPKANMLQRWHSSSICEAPIIHSMNFALLHKRHMNFKFEKSNPHMYVFQFCTCVYTFVEGLHPSHRPNLEKTRVSLVAPTS